ncbi:helix-turn-helix domain-containing protein [Streptomyces sp. Tu6071]|uniref:helix-turn-helix domain-containing protein n=1 Tax=Streptomyces sp. Tu6071 TaxID=355249 RepID=UPI0002EE2B92|nr:helix-turn-helix transcriptional regulator [Streptomyces sp. Tu6071]
MPNRRAVTGRSREPRRRFAQELRQLRSSHKVTLRQLSDRLGWDYSLFAKMEKGETLGGPEVVEALDAFYGTPGLLLALWELALSDKTQFKEQYRRYMQLEAEAVSLWHYAVSVLPGLLQTREYARETLSLGGLTGADLEGQIEARLSRRAVLAEPDAPPFRAILSESVLRTRMTDANGWRAQLQHLLEGAPQGNVTIQVLPFNAGLYRLMSTDIWFLRLLEGGTVAYVESAARGELIEHSEAVEALQRRYDSVRDQALSPGESRKFIQCLLEETPCTTST